eukprot:4362487-Prymnesium_polylepis.1
MQSPPCKAYSTANFQDRSDAPELIARSRDLGLETGRLFRLRNRKCEGSSSGVPGSRCATVWVSLWAACRQAPLLRGKLPHPRRSVPQ